MTGFLDRDGSFYAASEQFPIYGADNCVGSETGQALRLHASGQVTLNENKLIVFSPMLQKSLKAPRDIAFQFWRF